MPVTDPNRRGLLGQGSILSMTSVGESHVAGPAREVHHLESAEHAAAAAAGGRAGARGERARRTGRRRFASSSNGIARTRRARSCHRNIDPVGFALENFDAVGQWREQTREGLAIDSAGVLADGTKVDGPVALRKALLARPDVFAGTVTEKLLIYALGRGLEPVDMPVVREHRQERGRAELRHAVDCAGNRAERPVPDADEVDRY